MERKQEMNEFIAEYVKNYDGDSYEASAEQEDIANACKSSIQWADKTMIDKVCEWIEENHTLNEGVSGYFVAKELRKAMEK